MRGKRVFVSLILMDNMASAAKIRTPSSSFPPPIADSIVFFCLARQPTNEFSQGSAKAESHTYCPCNLAHVSWVSTSTACEASSNRQVDILTCGKNMLRQLWLGWLYKVAVWLALAIACCTETIRVEARLLTKPSTTCEDLRQG